MNRNDIRLQTSIHCETSLVPRSLEKLLGIYRTRAHADITVISSFILAHTCLNSSHVSWDPRYCEPCCMYHTESLWENIAMCSHQEGGLNHSLNFLNHSFTSYITGKHIQYLTCWWPQELRFASLFSHPNPHLQFLNVEHLLQVELTLHGVPPALASQCPPTMSWSFPRSLAELC